MDSLEGFRVSFCNVIVLVWQRMGRKPPAGFKMGQRLRLFTNVAVRL